MKRCKHEPKPASPWNQALVTIALYVFAVVVVGPLVAGFLQSYVLS